MFSFIRSAAAVMRWNRCRSSRQPSWPPNSAPTIQITIWTSTGVSSLVSIGCLPLRSGGLAKAAATFGEKCSVPVILDYFEKHGSGDDFCRMCVLDALIFNPDSYYGNFGILFDNETMAPISMCQVFDHNRSLCPDLDQEQLENPIWYIEKCRPLIGRDFLINARGLMTPEIRSDLKNLLGFRFRQHDRITAQRSDWMR